MAGFEENLQNLVAWARDGVTHDPNRLFRAIVMQFLSDENPPAEEDKPNLLKILRDMRPKVDLTIRQDLARLLSRYAKPPREIARLFADDELAVARIALETANGLTDDDLIEIARNGSVAHRQAIAMRRGLSPAVRMAVFSTGIESDKEKEPAPTTPEPAVTKTVAEPIAEPEETAETAETLAVSRSSALDKVEKALERHGARPIKRDFERAKEFLSKIQNVRTPPHKPSLVERAGRDIFADVRDMGDEPKTEDVARAEAFLAEINKTADAEGQPIDVPPETVATEMSLAAPAEQSEPPVTEPLVPEPESGLAKPQPIAVPAGPEVAEAAPIVEPETSVQVAAVAEPEEDVLDLEEVVPDEIEAETPKQPEPFREPEPASPTVAITEEVPEEPAAPEPEPVLQSEPVHEPEPTPEPAPEPMAAAPAPQAEVVVAGDLFRAGRRAEDMAKRLAGNAARERDFARAAVDWAWETDPDGIVTFLSEGAGQALGIAESRILTKALDELGRFTGEGRDPRKAAEAMSRRVPYRDQVFETATEAGGVKSWLVSAVPLFELRSGRFRGYRGTATADGSTPQSRGAPLPDTEVLEETVKAAATENEELVTEVQAAQAGVAARSDRMASVSHELRTPLNAIMGFSDAMASETFGPLDPKYKEYAKDILTSASEVNQIISDVLDKSKLEAGKVTLSTGLVPLMMLLEEARNDVASEVASREMDMTYAATTTDLVVEVDSDYAQRVVTTVLRSAVRFGRRGGRIGIESLLERPGVAQVNIWNDGPAISSETIKAMLPPEPKPGEPEKEPQVGLGLTLAVARGLARLMKGEVALQSKEGVGNRFIIEFPIET